MTVDPWYVTREDMKTASDIESTAYANAMTDRACEAGTQAVIGLTHRDFSPAQGTRHKDWPRVADGSASDVWLDHDEVISLTSVVSGDATIAPTDYFLEPGNEGPPYDLIRIDEGSSAAWQSADTGQRAIALSGLFGFRDDEDTAGVLAAAVSSTGTTTVDVLDSATIGVGSLIRVDTERMVVRGKALITTGQTIQAALTDDLSVRSVSVTTGSAYTPGEVLTLDAERVLVEDVAGNTLIVKRAVDGSTLATHTGSTIYAPRRLTVVRGARGTTPATHLTSAAVTVHRVPMLVSMLALAEGQTWLAQQSAKWARQIGSGENVREATARGLKDLRDQVFRAYGRKARKGVVGP